MQQLVRGIDLDTQCRGDVCDAGVVVGPQHDGQSLPWWQGRQRLFYFLSRLLF